MKKGQAGCAVRVVLDRRDPGGNAALLALEIHHADQPAVAAAAMAHSHTAICVAAAMPSARNGQGTLGVRASDLFKRVARHPALTGGGGLVFLDCHYFTPSKISRVCPSARVTIAFLKAGLRTSRRRERERRPRLAGAFMMFT